MDHFKVTTMQAYVGIGTNCEFKLSEAVLVYRAGGGGAFASLHQVKQGDNGVPYLAPGEPLTAAFLRTLAQGLGAQVKPEILPDNVLARTPDMLAWWSPPQRRVMFFGGTDQEARKLNDLVLSHPALIFKVAGKDLFVRAMATTLRPGPETPLKMAPYWNTDSRGLVCAGSMRVPESSDIASMPVWQDAYFQSEFTHAAGAVRLTSHSGGFIGLWTSLAGRKRFPARFLADAGETLQEFAARGSDS
jgi:PRTRC genetic system protein B